MNHPTFDHLERRRIYLFRHAQALGSESETMDYSSNIALTDQGRKQCLATHEKVKNINFDIAISSNYARAVQTAELILGDRVSILETSAYFRELDAEFKDFLKGAKNVDEATMMLSEGLWKMAELFPEQVEDVLRRAKLGLKMILEKPWSTAIIVAHSAFNRIFICHLLKLPITYLSVFEQDNAGMTILDLDVERSKAKLHRARLAELNTTIYNPAKTSSLLSDMESVALDSRTKLSKLFTTEA